VVVVGDFNRDGKVDFASLNSTGLSVVLGNGDGTFRPPVNYATGVDSFLVASDFDGDGNTDLAAGNFDGTITLLLGNGDGTFRPGASLGVGSTIGAMAGGDFNGDGKADLIFTTSNTISSGPFTSVNLLPGNGDGTFGAPTGYAYLGNLSGLPNPLLVGDWNGDGKPDVVVANVPSVYNPYPPPTLYPSTYSVTTLMLFGTGDGYAQNEASLYLKDIYAPAQCASCSQYRSPILTLVSGDFNGDGKTDLAVGGQAFGTNAAITELLLGNGDGTFQGPVSYPGIAMASGDFNGDGVIDLVVVGASGTPDILLGNGDGTFQQGPALPAGIPLRVADFNGDGKADILGTNSAGAFTVLLGANPGSVPAGITATGGTSQSAQVNAPFANALQVTVTNTAGSPVAGVAVAFTAPSNGASATLSSLSTLTYSSGLASVTATANNISGSYVVTATVGGLLTSFSLTNVIAGGSDLAAGKAATQSSTYPGSASAGALSAVDGNTDGNFADGSVTATNLDNNPWWQVDLGGSTAIGSVVIWNRTDCCGSRLTDYWVFISDTPFQATDKPASLQNRAGTFASHQTTAPSPSTLVSAGAQGRYGRVQLTGAGYLSLAEVQVFTSANLAQGKLATQSSNYSAASTAVLAVDGNTNGSFSAGSVTATNADTNAWWQVDLATSATVSSVTVWNRTDCCGSRLSDYWVFISDTPFLATDTPLTLQSRAGTFASHQTTAPSSSATISINGAQGRYVRVQLTGTDYLSLAEVQVFGNGGAPPPTDLAQGKTAAQSSTLPGTPLASAAVDGNTDGNFNHGSVTATNADTNAWWQVDLGAPATVSSVVVWNRTDCCSGRLSDYWVFISNTPFFPTDTPTTLQSRAGTFASHQTTAPSPSTTIATNGAQGRYVRVQLTGADYLSLAEVQVLGAGGAPPPSNLAQGKAAAQSSTLPGAPPASAAVDGNTDGSFFDGSVTATNLDTNAWWQVDLGASAAVSSVVVFNRTDCCSARLSDYWVFISDTPFLATDTPVTLQSRAGTFASHQTTAPSPSTVIAAGAQGRYVRVQLSSPNYLSLAEVQVFGQ
jgi:hypothetical protein